MYGWRARLGVLIPSGIVATESELELMKPEGVSCHYHRFKFIGGKTNEQIMERLKRAEDHIADGTEMIADARPAVVAMTGTGVSFIGGYGYDQKLIKKMKERNGNLPTTTTTTSVIDALNAMKIKKVSLAMAYVEPVSKTVMKFVEDSGFKVVQGKWLGLGGPEIGEVSNETIYHLATEADDPESEAIFISCTNLHAAEIIEKLENDLQKPVISSNQATMWNMLRLANIKDKIQGFGQLFDY